MFHVKPALRVRAGDRMPLFTPKGEAAYGYIGVIEAAARVRATTADVWAAVRAEASRAGRETLGIAFSDVTAIRSWATRMRNADAAFEAANPTDNITANMATTAIWSPQDLNGIATTPSYSVRAVVTVQQSDGTTANQWMTWNFADNPFNQTVGDYTNTITDVFASRVQTAPEGTATPSGTLVSVSNINIQVF